MVGGEILFNERITFELRNRSTGRPELGFAVPNLENPEQAHRAPVQNGYSVRNLTD